MEIWCELSAIPDDLLLPNRYSTADLRSKNAMIFMTEHGLVNANALAGLTSYEPFLVQIPCYAALEVVLCRSSLLSPWTLHNPRHGDDTDHSGPDEVAGDARPAGDTFEILGSEGLSNLKQLQLEGVDIAAEEVEQFLIYPEPLALTALHEIGETIG